MIPEGNPGEKETAYTILCQKWEHASLPPRGGLHSQPFDYETYALPTALSPPGSHGRFADVGTPLLINIGHHDSFVREIVLCVHPQKTVPM